MEILHRDTLLEGGFAGLKEHRLVKSPAVFGPSANNDGSWSGIGHFVYLADARFMPYGETKMHKHLEVDVISVIVDGRIAHKGSLENGTDLLADDVQVQRAGGEGFSHNEVNPDDNWNRMIQLWVLPEHEGLAADYKVYRPALGETRRIYGGGDKQDADFSSKTVIDVSLINTGENIEVSTSFMAYLSRGKGLANSEHVKEGDLIRGESLKFEATQEVQLIVIYTQAS